MISHQGLIRIFPRCAMKEDDSPIYREDAAANLATVRHIAINMLCLEDSKQAGIKRKQKMAAMNTDYLETMTEFPSSSDLLLGTVI